MQWGRVWPASTWSSPTNQIEIKRLSLNGETEKAEIRGNQPLLSRFPSYPIKEKKIMLMYPLRSTTLITVILQVYASYFISTPIHLIFVY